MNKELSLAEQLLLLEESLLTPEVRGSPESLADLLADDFLEIGSSGQVYDKQQVIAALQQEPPRSLSIADFRVRLLAPGVVLATFRTDQADGSMQALRCSIWTRAQGRWRLSFHQGTPIQS